MARCTSAHTNGPFFFLVGEPKWAETILHTQSDDIPPATPSMQPQPYTRTTTRWTTTFAYDLASAFGYSAVRAKRQNGSRAIGMIFESGPLWQVFLNGQKLQSRRQQQPIDPSTQCLAMLLLSIEIPPGVSLLQS